MNIPFADLARYPNARKIEVLDHGYEVTLWPKKKPADLFSTPPPDLEKLRAEAQAERLTPPRFTYDTDPLHCERMAGIRARPANPNRKPTPRMIEYLRRFKHPQADSLTFNQAQEYLDERFGRKEKQGEMKIVVEPAVTNP